MAITSPQGQWVWDEEAQDWIPSQQGQQGNQAGDVQAALQQAALMDLLTTGGKNLSKIQAFQGFFPDTRQQKKDAAALRKEFAGETKALGFQELQNSWNKVKNAGDTGAGDLTIVYSYIKSLDPTTAVREGEIDLTKAAESIPSNIIRAYNKAKKGQAISPQLRQQMISEIGMMYNERAKKQKELNAFYSGLASDSGLDPNDVVGRYSKIEMAEEPAAIQKQSSSGGNPYLSGLAGLAGYGAAKSIPVAGQIPGVAGAVGGATSAVADRAQQVLKGEAPPEAAKFGLAGRAPTGREMGQIGGGALLDLLFNAPKLVGFAKGGGFRGAAGRARETAAVQAQQTSGGVSGDMVLQSMKKEAESLTGPIRRGVLKEIEQIKPLLQKQAIPVEKSVEIFKNSPAFTKGGDIKATGAGYFYDALRKGIKEEWNRVAPEVLKQTKNLRTSYELPKAASKATWQAAKTGAAVSFLKGMLGF